MKEDIMEEIELPQGVTATVAEGTFTIKGAKGGITRSFRHPKVKLRLEHQKIVLTAIRGSRREKTLIGSYRAHLLNMIRGVQQPFEYTLTICSGHFPMTVAIAVREFSVKNFLGESIPRRLTLVQGVTVVVTGNKVTVSSPDRELAGQAAARIEGICRITNRDRRIFQDGIYIIEKPEKVVN